MLRFSEPLNFELSRIEVVDERGRSVTLGASLPVEGDPRAMRRKLGLLEPGIYRVRWLTVSTLDGHALRGSYEFGIGRAAFGNERVVNDPLSSEGLLGLLGRFVALAGLTLWAGYGALGQIARRAGVGADRLLRLAIISPIAASLGTALSLLSLSIVSTGTARGLGPLLSAPSGRLRAALIVIGLLGASVRGRRWASAPLAALGVVAEASSGHAAASPLPVMTILSFSVHLAAVGTWVFAIAASLLSRDRILPSLRAFSPYAVAAAGIVAATGIANAVLELTSPRDLLSTGYGRTVVGKGGALVLMAGFGFIHYRRRSRPDPSAQALAKPLRREAVAAAAAIVLATLLVGFPNPPREAESSEPLAGVDPVLASLERRKALSIAAPSGPYVLGLTLLPPRPGSIEFRLQVVGVEPGDALRNSRIRGRSEAGEFMAVGLEPCLPGALSCFAGRAALPSGGLWELEVSLVGNRGPIEARWTIPLPSPDGTAEFERALRSMEQLRSATMVESLRASIDSPSVTSRYRFLAPNAFAFEVRESERIVIGDRTFSRESPTAAWRGDETPGLEFTWPKGWFRDFWQSGAAAVRLPGRGEVDGIPCREISFVRATLPAWFTICVGLEDGMVHRMVMLAQGHLMEQTYRDFNQPIEIEPPI